MPTYPVDHVVRYGEHPEQIADVRLPRGGPAHSVVLLVHGGFWRQEYDRHHTDVVAADLAGRGYAVVSLEYRRLGGSGGWPETFDDVATAMDVLPSLVAGVAPAAAKAPVIALGHSAGGHLVLWAAGRNHLPAESRWQHSAPPTVSGVVALAPVADLACAHELRLDDGVVDELLGGAGPHSDRRRAELDPSGLPPDVPVVVVHGALDRHVPLEVTQRYLEAVRAKNADVALDVVAGAEHFALIDPGSTAWPRVLAALQRVLAAR